MSTLTYQKDLGRWRRQKRVRKKVLGTDDLPRICIFRSLKHIYVQVISDEKGATLVSTSTLSKELKGKMQKTKGMEAAKEVGAQIARMCKDKGITKAVFDRNGFLYHGRVKALAEAAREGGLQL
tara:strand:- start:129 stop:500 length:372 start_codon:yes stop_codon:yes gene_type:complete